MSQENVETARRAIAAFNERDLGAFDELADPSWEWHTSMEMPEAAVHHGRDAVKAFGYEVLDQWEEFELDIERLIDSGDRVLVLCRVRAIGKGSGVRVNRFIAYLTTLRDGKLIRTDVFLDRQAALAALGLSE